MSWVRRYNDEYFQLHYSWRNCRGEQCCGDAVLVQREENSIFLALIDSLGHGPKAAEMSDKLKDYLKKYHYLPLDELLQKAHRHFEASRGAALALCRLYEDGRLEYIGLGNVVVRILEHQQEQLLVSKDGVLGQRARQFQVSHHQLLPGYALMMYSDGIKGRPLYRKSWPLRGTPELLSDIIENYGRSYDDLSIVYLNLLK